ncbi:spermatogenesis-associated protein 20 [Halyomorpha halys]|uniref:spermatogenesis-associated protein 20 n=1 Tax=Halyomorpha halys TaxID=286706 RepID=UPI0006D51245|nr:spermatogenesis-associated protein 20 [Halyomorpha halys]XP_024217363.1 spermatogenesis-associated protein 20 [Halyomorpha halys]
MFFGRVYANCKAFSALRYPYVHLASKLVICRNFHHPVGLYFKHIFPQRPLSTSVRLLREEMATEKSVTESEQKQYRNRLGKEKSPYLLQHATNPVDWYPWGEEAFAKAREEDKIIFLSVGYSTCHWCHVMERESFENENVASIMNEYFVNVKVDREERPDVDKIYMTFVQATSGSGGWPMSVFLTPDLKPVAGGTYFPPKDNYGRPGFKTVLLNMAKQWAEQRAKVSATGKRITELLEQTTAFDVSLAGSLIGGEVPGKETWDLCFNQLSNSYEPLFGGFSMAPKFPQPANYSFLFHLIARDPKSESGEKAKEMALHTLDKMAKGGIHDHVAQGFARYSTDSKWHVPHFEKMLYDQAQLAIVYSNAYLLTKDNKYANVVRDILTYVSRDLSHPEGGFYSAEDADSYPTHDSTEKKEGAFCVWTYDQINSLLSIPLQTKPEHNLSSVFCHYYSIKPRGNVSPENDPHGELKGQNVLAVFHSERDTCDKFDLSLPDLHKELEIGKKILFEERQKRPKPHLDNKIITSWNGLMISAYAKAASALNDEGYKQRAIDAANFVKKYLYTDKKRLLRSCYTENNKIAQIKEPIEGFLDDYACLIKGLIDLYECTFNPDWLVWASVLQASQDELFWDHGLAGYFSTSNSDGHNLFRLKEDQDGAEPSGNSVAAGNLLRLGCMLDCPEMKEKASKLLSSFTSRLSRIPVALPEMVCALMLYHDAPTLVVVTGDMSKSETVELIRVAQSNIIPGIVLVTTGSNSDNFIVTRNESVRKMKKLGDREAAYVCRGRACSLPVTSPVDLAALLRI